VLALLLARRGLLLRLLLLCRWRMAPRGAGARLQRHSQGAVAQQQQQHRSRAAPR
jgi:hypothetical protein